MVFPKTNGVFAFLKTNCKKNMSDLRFVSKIQLANS